MRFLDAFVITIVSYIAILFVAIDYVAYNPQNIIGLQSYGQTIIDVTLGFGSLILVEVLIFLSKGITNGKKNIKRNFKLIITN